MKSQNLILAIAITMSSIAANAYTEDTWTRMMLRQQLAKLNQNQTQNDLSAADKATMACLRINAINKGDAELLHDELMALSANPKINSILARLQQSERTLLASQITLVSSISKADYVKLLGKEECESIEGIERTNGISQDLQKLAISALKAELILSSTQAAK